jgi:hypothetical protein
LYPFDSLIFVNTEKNVIIIYDKSAKQFISTEMKQEPLTPIKENNQILENLKTNNIININNNLKFPITVNSSHVVIEFNLYYSGKIIFSFLIKVKNTYNLKGKIKIIFRKMIIITYTYIKSEKIVRF